MSVLAEALAVLGRAGLGLPPAAASTGAVQVGEYTLLAHQVEAVARLRPMLAAHGGALLADAVGLGKTIVALALAREYERTSVIAPAALLSMWRDTSRRAAVKVHVRSLQQFSVARDAATDASASGTQGSHLIIIDEAHHLRNPCTRRYAGVAAFSRGATILLLSATPVHNRCADLAHLLALYLGQTSHTFSLEQLHAHVVRRDDEAASRKPTIVAHPSFSVGDNSEITRALSELPPPVPTRDGVAAGALITLGLVRAWCSSASACLSAVQRRRSRAAALDGILSEGRWPSHMELRAWTATEDTVQLGFTAMLVSKAPEPAAAHSLASAREQLQHHCAALDSLQTLLRDAITTLDRTRAESLRRVRRAHAGVTIIAFSQYADTVRAIGRVLRWDAGVATLTSRSARIASGPLSRQELLRRVAPRAHGAAQPPSHERVYLLLTTDLLAEGVNLQDAGVVVHLDWPWTPAAIAQREGRIARLGSLFQKVHAYAISPPGGGITLLRLAERLRVKARIASVVLAPDTTPRATRRLMALPTASSPMERTLRRWVSRAVELSGVLGASRPTAVVVLHSSRAGWLAARQSDLMGGWFTSGRTRVDQTNKAVSTLVKAIDRAAERTPIQSLAVYHGFSRQGMPQAPVNNAEAPNGTMDSRTVAFLRAILRALHRHAQRAQRHTLISTLQSPVHRAERVIRNLLTGASLQERLRLQPLAAAASRSVRCLRGVGDERALEVLLREPPVKGREYEWLQSLSQLQDGPDTEAPEREVEHTAPDAALPCVIVLLLPARPAVRL